MSASLPKPNLPQPVYWLSLLAFALRIVARLSQGIGDFWVNGYTLYFDLAQSIAKGKGFSVDGIPTAFRVPLYPILLAGLTLGHKVFWPIVIAQSTIGAGTTICAALLAREMFCKAVASKAAIVAAAITAVYPYYVVHDTAMQETSLFTLITLMAVTVTWRIAQSGTLWLAALCGFLLGLDVLTRAPVAPFAMFVPAWLIWRKRSIPALICAFCLVLTVSPWLCRCYKLTGHLLLTTEQGYELWNGNNDILFQYFPAQSVDESIHAHLRALSAQDKHELQQLSANEAVEDNWFRQRGLAYIRAHPMLTAINGLRKVAIAFDWMPTPRGSPVRALLHFFSYSPVMLLGLWGMWRRRSHWREDSLIYALFVTFALVTAVFFAHTNHRSYLDVYWIMFAAGFLAEVVSPNAKNKLMANSGATTPIVS